MNCLFKFNKALTGNREPGTFTIAISNRTINTAYFTVNDQTQNEYCVFPWQEDTCE